MSSHCCYRSVNALIMVLDSSDLKNNSQKTGFKYVTHSISCVEDCNLEFLIYSDTKKCYNPINIDDNGNGGEYTIKCKENYDQVYVYFYEKDPRPLLFCYGDEAYRPVTKSTYSGMWVKDDTFSKCVCPETGKCTGDDSDCCKLLKPLTEVVGFLNEVDLSKHPTGTGNGDCNTSSGSPGTASTCNTPAAGQGNTCTYTVHTYKGRDVKVRVTCSDVKGTGETRNECSYKKLTHEPAGMCEGSTDPINGANGFRLGDVVYKGNGCSNNCSIPYYTENREDNQSEHWCKPLISVGAYFYSADTKYEDPLLVILEFQNGEGAKEYYKLTERSDSTMNWTKDTGASTAVSSRGQDLIDHLDGIRYGIKKVLKVEINKQGQYQAMGRVGRDAGNGFEPLKNGGSQQIQVAECTDKCTQLASEGYKCYQHQISSIKNGFDYNEIAGVAFTIPGQGDKPIEIKLFNCTATDCSKNQNGEPGKNGEKGKPINLTYNKCMGDVYVFFYGKGGDSNPDTVPLMLWYNNSYYGPCDRENYFTKWIQVSELADKAKQGPPCEGGDGGEKLAERLNEVNKALNQIDLDPDTAKLAGAGKGYGLPEGGGRGIRPNASFKIERVKLTKQIGPSKPSGNAAYTRIVHRTVNGFQIGDIKYGGNEIVSSGVSINGPSGSPATIDVNKNNGTNNNHTSLVKQNKCNTVVAYYSKDDTDRKLPQLIVIFKTDSEVTSKPVTGTGYGYYILSSKTGGASGAGGADGGVNYEYVWHQVKNDPPKQTPVTLNDATDFKLLNSVVILIEQRPNNGTPGNNKYGDDEIGKAISSAKLKSPGREDINRITGKDISVNDATTESTCLNKTGFKLITHDISQLVNPNGKLSEKLRDVSLIAGLRFLIPTSDTADKYQQLTLSEGSSTRSSRSDQHYLYYKNPNKKVSIFFYGDDPRPLLLCYNGNAYKPNKQKEPTADKQVMVEYTEWVKVTNINTCECNGVGSKDKLLDTLNEVIGFLNPVQLNPKQIPNDACETITAKPQSPPGKTSATFELHDYTHSIKIYMKISRDTVGCYGKYTYEPAGLNGKGAAANNGFRLGNVFYTDDRRTNDHHKLDYHSNPINNKYNPLLTVNVYYYNEDTDYKDPLLVVLEFKKNGESKGTNDKEYYKLTSREDSKINWSKVDDKQTKQLGEDPKLLDYLNELRYGFKKIIRIEIQWNTQGNYPLKVREGKGADTKNGFEKLKNGDEEKNITVEDCTEKCSKLSGTNYKCFKHKITELENQTDIAGLKFYIPNKDKGPEVELELRDDNPTFDVIPQLYYNTCMGDIFVYFYGDDPRPLLLCYNKEAYYPVSISSYDNHKWVKDKSVTKCDCTGDDDILLLRLVFVSNLLNPLNIKIVPRRNYNCTFYNIHWFNGKPIRIQVTSVEAKDGFCYNRYTHKHFGICCNGEGFRLGNIRYRGECIKDKDFKEYPGSCINSVIVNEEPPSNYKSADEVVVFYYKYDTSHEFPMVVAMGKTNGNGRTTCKLYYVLVDKVKKIYEKKEETSEFNLDDNNVVTTKLDEALFSNSNQLQIIIDRIPEPKLYCPPKPPPKPENNAKKNGKKQEEYKPTFPCVDRGNNQKGTPAPNSKKDPSSDVIPPSYKAQLYESNGSQLRNGPTAPKDTPTSIQVTPVKCKQLSRHGYRCYEHQITSLDKVEEIGGLKFYLWDNGQGTSGGGCGTECTTTATGAGCPAASGTDTVCRELCLYGPSSGAPNSVSTQNSNCPATATDASPVSGTSCTATATQNGQLTSSLPYTTCKGNVYVFFYGEDPRPLMLCYDGNAYGPRCKGEYDRQWVCVGKVPGCVVESNLPVAIIKGCSIKCYD